MAGTIRETDKRRMGAARNSRSMLGKRIHERWDALKTNVVYYVTLVSGLLLIYLLIRPMAFDIRGFRLGYPSPEVVPSPFEFEYDDEIITTAKKDEAASHIAPVYSIRQENLDRLKNRIANLSAAVQNTPFVDESNGEQAWIESVLELADFSLEDQVYDTDGPLPENVPTSTYKSLIYYRQYKSFWTALEKHFTTALGVGIADDLTPLTTEEAIEDESFEPQVMLVTPDGGIVYNPAKRVQSPDMFFAAFQSLITTDFSDEKNDYAKRELAIDLISAAYAGPTLIYNSAQTETLRQEERKRVVPVKGHIAKDEIIIKKGDLVTPELIQKLRALKHIMSLSPLAEIGYLVLACLYVVTLIAYLNTYFKEILSDGRKLIVIIVGVLLILSLAKVTVHLSLLDLGSKTLNHIGYAVPVGALGVILTLLINSRLAMYCCGFTSIYTGLILSGGFQQQALPFVLVSFITATAAIHEVTHIRQRSDLYRAGGAAMLLAAIAILAISLNQIKSLEDILKQAEEIRWALIWGGLNGLLISILSIALLPIFEDFYGVTTDIKLLELSRKTELLQTMEQEAPGSYQHCMRVATLAESAAEAIGANALLVRVGCYYHDIGKIVKPQYFVENQQTSADKAKHSKLNANMSCLIIRNHVKNGIEIAKKHKLPKPIIDFIPEHHGTTLMSYFYYQALEAQETEGTVKEEDFRYPGPKPQSKETAITMLADALEASSRTLENVSEGDVRQLVRKIINERFMDGQFDECNLTLKDLHQLFLTFSETIMHTFHQRIAYPSAPAAKEKGTDDRADEGSNVSEQKAASVGGEHDASKKANGSSRSEKQIALKLE